MRETEDDAGEGRGKRTAGTALPGVVVVFTAGMPAVQVLPLDRGRLVIGREAGGPTFAADTRLSRRHVEFSVDGGEWTVRDLGSRNGTFVDGSRVDSVLRTHSPRFVRIGGTLLRPVADVRPFLSGDLSHGLESGGVIAGPALRRALEAVQNAAAGSRVLIIGETGTGKEIAAKRFHEASAARGPFVAVNCAAIPDGLAERLFFGAKRGAFSGAGADADGHVQAAENGTLFLDEIGELDPRVQAKLLRFLETREVTPVGAARSVRVHVGICAATHRDLRADVANGRFRADLYHRLAQPLVQLPPLRDRLEEIPWLAQSALPRDLRLDVRFVEALLGRTWPGNVRELLACVRDAAASAREHGDSVVTSAHLADGAGTSAIETPRDARVDTAKSDTAGGALSVDSIKAALAAKNGNVAAAARVLGLHRTQLYRQISRLGIDLGRGRRV